jgi:hypothetical protein
MYPFSPYFPRKPARHPFPAYSNGFSLVSLDTMPYIVEAGRSTDSFLNPSEQGALNHTSHDVPGYRTKMASDAV